jgi:hypothetical protein
LDLHGGDKFEPLAKRKGDSFKISDPSLKVIYEVLEHKRQIEGIRQLFLEAFRLYSMSDYTP